MSGLDGGL
jgi:hypothetical protein